MALPPDTGKMTAAEYLAFEEAATEKHEYHAGEIFAMAGGSRAHSKIIAYLIGEMHNELSGGVCEVYDGSLKVRVEAFNSILYPDLSVTGTGQGPSEQGIDVVMNPVFLVEVLSPSTAAYDRGQKFIQYQSLPSLKEYVVVEQSHPQVDVFQRVDGQWTSFRNHTRLDESVHFASLDVTIPMARIYRAVQLDNSPFP